MTTIDGNTIVASATGPSNSLFLLDSPEGKDSIIFARAAAWGDTDVQVSDNGTDWGDLKKDDGTVVNLTENSSFQVPGGIYIRLDVNSLDGSNAITLVAK